MKLLLLCIAATCALAVPEVDWSKIKRKHVNPSLVEAIYGAAVDQRITGGEEAEEGSFPFQAALFIEQSDGTYFCGGTLISVNYVLTAAHCLESALSSYVLLGAHNIRESEPSQVQISVENQRLHEGYDNRTYLNDIAVLKLSEPAPLTERIQLATLPTYSDVSTTFAGSLGQAVGWGQVSDSDSSISSVLRFVESNVITNLLCNINYLGLIQNSNICLNGNDGKSTCGGDSGGPLLVQGVQVGVTSFGIILGCEVGWPSVYTRVTSYLDWIATHTDVEILP